MTRGKFRGPVTGLYFVTSQLRGTESRPLYDLLVDAREVTNTDEERYCGRALGN